MTTRITIHAKPGAKKNAITAWSREPLSAHVSIAAPPIDGRANDELVRFLAKALGLKKRDVAFVTGETSRTKILDLEIERADLEAKLAL